MLYNCRSGREVHHNRNIFKDSKPKISLFGESCGVLLTSQAIDPSGSDWQASGSMILKALAEERKSENTGLQVMNVIKYQKPKTKLEFNFRS